MENATYSGSQKVEDIAWLDTNSNKKTHPIGLLRPNELGIYDLCGNVWEWCSDWYDDDVQIKFRKNPRVPTLVLFAF